MYRFFANEDFVKDNQIFIIGEDKNHILNSIRMKIHENTEIVVNKKVFLCELYEINKNNVIFNILKELKSDTEPAMRIHLIQCVPKMDKFDFIIQKAVELGVYSIIPFISERTVVKIKQGKEEYKLKRWNKISKEAAMQSKRNIIPKIEKIIDFNTLLDFIKDKDNVIICYEEELYDKSYFDFINHDIKDVYVIIGSEGGFSKTEVEKIKNCGGKSISLGKRILRVETASIVVLTLLQHEFGDI